MSFLTATNTELIYAMEGAGSDVTVSTASVITPFTSATVAPAYLPPVFSIWQPSSIVGKGFRVVLSGTYDTAASDAITLKYAMDTSQATGAGSTFGSGGSNFVLFSTGSGSWPLATAGGWYAQVDIIFTAYSGTSSNLSGFVNGFLVAGSANNAATSQTTTGQVTMLGCTTSAGASAVTFNAWPGTQAFFAESQVTAGTAPTHFALQQHMIYGLN